MERLEVEVKVMDMFAVLVMDGGGGRNKCFGDDEYGGGFYVVLV